MCSLVYDVPLQTRKGITPQNGENTSTRNDGILFSNYKNGPCELKHLKEECVVDKIHYLCLCVATDS